jgi:deoxycytidylate deaminase
VEEYHKQALAAMKSDQYLNLCLEQATLSPLRYRHGCIIVKGGKIIGQGYNDHRPGYDGGALKTGQLSTRSSGRPTDAKKSKSKTKPQDPPSLTFSSSPLSNAFVAHENMVGGAVGHCANQPLTMHAEMMAINEALSAYGTLSSSTASGIKPSFKLSGRGDKRKQALREYVDSICIETTESAVQRTTEIQGGASSGGQGPEWCFSPGWGAELDSSGSDTDSGELLSEET